ncbi:DUF229 domain-containing protein [Aquimarina sp. BL5]|nr:DUF229 domain-containing protein [Aquimarina sp. BL5]RKN09567.1 DUF229 domain-containing protein [Aquimarina sp. BL5]
MLKKYRFTKQLTSILVFTILFSVFACAQNKNQKPNIVWITSEDNSKHYMKLFDKNGIATPHIESLAAKGITFNNAFSNAAVCSAARSTLITSNYGPRLASHYHRTQEKVTLPENLEMFPVYLRKAGYYTANNAKEDYNFIKSNNVWDDSSRKASWKNREEGQPFFYVHNIHSTHESSVHFPKENVTINKTINQNFVQPNHPQTALLKYTNAMYREKIAQMDKEVGEVLSKLIKDGLLENTIIFYFGDHGGVLPESKGYLKETGLHVPLVIYVPEKYKDFTDYKVGSNANGFVSFVDFGATILNVAGVEIPKSIDGKPFLGKNVKTKAVEKRDKTFGYADRFDEKYDMVRSYRKGKYKYIRNFQPFNVDALMNNYRYKQLAYREWEDLHQKGKLNAIQSQFFEPKSPEELYNIEADPYETNNLAKESAYKKTVKEMRQGLNKWMKTMPDLSFFPEHFLVQNAFENPYKFGQNHKKNISKYIDVANLALLDFEKADSKIKKSIKSVDPWERYWALVVCSSFNKKANAFIDEVLQIIEDDKELINRVRAAEFLAIIGKKEPSKDILKSLYESENELEALLILNSIVLLQDHYQQYTFNIELENINPKVKRDEQVQERLKYLNVL